MANAAEKQLFNVDLVKEYLKSPYDKMLFSALMHMSLALYQALGLKFLWAKELLESLPKENKEAVGQHLEKLKQNKVFKLDNQNLSSERLKVVFNNYFRQEQSSLEGLLSLKQDAGLEYAFSQVFTPKQRELFLKKLRNEKMSKTEREYYSRVVRKKVLALANTELHQLAQKVK